MGSMSEGPVLIVSPALASNNNGNWHTASRWRNFLSALAPTEILQQWGGEPARAMVALHARRSAQSIARFREAHPNRPIALVLTGTDIYGEMALDDSARQSLKCATHLVVLQEEALSRLDPVDRTKARVIVQSAPVVLCAKREGQRSDYIAVGHLRKEKDPLTLMQAARLLVGKPFRIFHIGEALEPELGNRALETMKDCPNYRWLGGLSQPEVRQHIACARALVHMSQLEGGANVVIEAARSQVPVLATRIDGNVGLLGRDYDGYFSIGNALELTQLMERMFEEAAFAKRLKAQCAVREPLFEPAVEEASVQALLTDMLLNVA
jgi:putative glycosyltransferase (TIGR04348 family)